MSRRKTAEEIEKECQEADDARSALWWKQQDCSHYDAKAVRFHWSTGKVTELRCPDCGAECYFDHDYP